MLFSSYEYLLLFLPATYLIYCIICRAGGRHSITFLVLASLFFYGWWNPVYLPLILGSMTVNFFSGRSISRFAHTRQHHKANALLFAGVLFNLTLLGYFKYAGFLTETANAALALALTVPDIVLPLAISFFTFQQIAYLVDARRGITEEYRFMHYALFVTFFPQLIAGPIVHHRDMLPQFLKPGATSPQLSNIAIGLTILSIGLFKKAVLADSLAGYATPIFELAATGHQPSPFEAWGGALSYTFQLYFDFSGYSDMAIGSARLFGIRLPLNFFSPSKATSIVEFWRRWHMTLSRFLRDYLYIPLGGNRQGDLLRYRNLLITMLLGGLWHGAGWTFILWGGLHGAYLAMNHLWIATRERLWPDAQIYHPVYKAASWALTFVAVVTGWVFFRAENIPAATTMLAGMFGLNGIALPNALMARLGDVGAMLQLAGVTSYLGGGQSFVMTWLWLLITFPIVLWLPNTHQLLQAWGPAFDSYRLNPETCVTTPSITERLQWRPSLRWALVTSIAGTFGLMALTRVSEFLYFQF